MKLQHLSVIFIIIIMPIVMVMSIYTNNLVKVANTKADYDKILMNSTYDAVRAYQLNTLNNSFSSVSESRLRDVRASSNTFFSSLASGLSQSGLTKNELNDYIPAILFTLYDGYYIYTPYKNIASTKNNSGSDSSSSVSFSTDGDNSSNMEFDFKPFTYYSCEYKSQTRNFDIVVNYTLDNYISVMGTYNGEYFTKSGYYIKPDGINIADGTKTVTISKNGNTITMKPETLGEYISLVDQKYDTSGQAKNGIKTNKVVTTEHKGPTYYKYINYHEEKYYFDKSPYKDSISWQGVPIFYLQNNNRIYISQDMANTLSGYVGADVTNEGNFKDVNYYYYYKDAVDFSKSVYEKLKDITVDDAITDSFNKTYETYVENTNDVTGERNASHAKTDLTGKKIFDYNAEGNDPELDSSDFNNHRIDVIVSTIESDLTTSITNFNRFFSQDYSYVMPALDENDWNKIANNVTTVTFMQGMVIGNYQFYNNYAVVANTKNKEFISKNSIYVEDYQDKPPYDGSTNYHSIGCVSYNESASKNVVGYRNIDYELQKYICISENNIEINYYLQPQSAGYECLVSRNQTGFTADDYLGFENKTVNYDKSDGSTASVSLNSEIRRAYIQALAREKAALSKNLSNLNVK